MDESKFLDEAIEEVKAMLTKKREIWTKGQGPFQNFDIHGELGVSPVQMALAMCNLKMNRLKSCWTRHTFRSDTAYGFVEDEDAYDSWLDLAAYSMIGMALTRRDQYHLRTQKIADEVRKEVEDTMYLGDDDDTKT